jgi:hypothetical protein
MSSSFSDHDEFGRFTKLTKEAVDTAVGLGVIGLQRLQVGRVELSRRLARHETLGPTYATLREQALRRAELLDTVVTEALHTVESTLEPIADRLPGPARHVASVAQGRVDELHAKMSRYLSDAGRTQPPPNDATD